METTDFRSYFDLIAAVPDKDLSEEEQDELVESIEELRIRCTAGMLLCLERQQRMIYILGEMFEVDHNLGAEIMGISKGNFRIRLMRARNDLSNWMRKRCSLVDRSNPCKCPKKTKSFIKAGVVDPDDLKFNSNYKQRIRELSETKATRIIETVEDITREVFQSHPFQQPREPVKIIDKILENELIRDVLKL